MKLLKWETAGEQLAWCLDFKGLTLSISTKLLKNNKNILTSLNSFRLNFYLLNCGFNLDGGGAVLSHFFPVIFSSVLKQEPIYFIFLK